MESKSERRGSYFSALETLIFSSLSWYDGELNYIAMQKIEGSTRGGRECI